MAVTAVMIGMFLVTLICLPCCKAASDGSADGQEQMEAMRKWYREQMGKGQE